MFRRFFHLATLALGPALLGVGTIFQPKARAEDHWSTSPKVVIVCEAEPEAPGGPPSPDVRRQPWRVVRSRGAGPSPTMA